MKKSFNYRLGLDAGTNSIGFALIELDENDYPINIIHLGVRIFSDGRDPKSGASLAVDRRTARGMRRRRDRLVLRKQHLMDMLIEKGLMPQGKAERKKLENLDPYYLRKKALDERLELYELGRVVFHLNQRRGFKSNRKQAVKDNEAGAINNARQVLEQKLKSGNFRTYGEFLYSNPAKRIRNISGDANKIAYDFYPQRSMLEAEYDYIIESQSKHYSELLTPEIADEIKNLVFFQRPLKPVQKGRCSLIPSEERAYSALPSSQRFRILKEVNNLEITDKLWRRNRNDLTDEQREKVISELYKKKTVSFDGLRKTLKLDSSTVFNLESEHRVSLGGATTHITLSKSEYFGGLWANIPLPEQDEVVGKLLDDTLDDAELAQWLKEKFNLPDDNIKSIINAPLEDGTMKFSSKAILQIIPYLEQGKNEFEAITACGWQHANRYTGELVDELPYYGILLESSVSFGTGNESDSEEKRYGKIANPTVHIMLNQLRRLVNELIQEFGRPKEIAVELSRDLRQSRDEKLKAQREIAKNTKANEKYNASIAAVGLTPNAEYRLRLKLHEQQHELCVYSSGNKKISVAELLSDAVEIDHILPFSRTFDDSTANKVVVFREANRIKGNKTPHGAFAHDMANYNEILERASNLPGSKKWRFYEDAMERFEDEKNGDAGWLARQLNDTSYMSRVAREYLRYVVGDRVKGYPAVDTYPGGVTAKLRRGWGFNNLLPTAPDGAEKNRTDHRHHAIDALVIACANRSMLQKISSANARSGNMDEDWTKNLTDKAPPYTNYNRADLQRMVDNIIISHKQDHGTLGKGDSGSTSSRLHEDTFYGKSKNQLDRNDGTELAKKGVIRLHVRAPLAGIKEKDISDIVDDSLRRRIAEVMGKRGNKKYEQAIADFAKENNIHHVRIFKEKSESAMRAICDKEGKTYRYVATGGNHHIDIFCPIKDKKTDDGTKYKAGKWYAETITHFDGNKKDFSPKWQKEHPTAKLIMRLHINDMVAYDEEGKREIRRVKKIDGATERVYLVPHLVAKEEADKLSWAASANKLQEKNARKISVTPAGKVLDAGRSPVPKPFQKKEVL